ncbi:hypothetical protein HZS_5095 [Henneguya salminicola]|nr:hypothetical protein HZS_5095 [Henneguya salminicola]
MDYMTSYKDITVKARPNSARANAAIIHGMSTWKLHPPNIAINFLTDGMGEFHLTWMKTFHSNRADNKSEF